MAPPVVRVPARQFPVTVHFARRTELRDYLGAAFKKARHYPATAAPLRHSVAPALVTIVSLETCLRRHDCMFVLPVQECSRRRSDCMASWRLGLGSARP